MVGFNDWCFLGDRGGREKGKGEIGRERGRDRRERGRDKNLFSLTSDQTRWSMSNKSF